MTRWDELRRGIYGERRGVAVGEGAGMRRLVSSCMGTRVSWGLHGYTCELGSVSVPKWDWSFFCKRRWSHVMGEADGVGVETWHGNGAVMGHAGGKNFRFAA